MNAIPPSPPWVRLAAAFIAVVGPCALGYLLLVLASRRQP